MQHSTSQITYELTFVSKDPRTNATEKTSRIKIITEKLKTKPQFSEWPTDSVRSFYSNSVQSTTTLRFTFNYIIEDNAKVYEYIDAIQAAFNELQFTSQVEIGMTVDTSFVHLPSDLML